jgi:hypothetical protein
MRVPPKVFHQRIPDSVVPSGAVAAESHCDIELESVLRIRPLLKKERDDAVLLEPQKAVMRYAPDVAILNPFHPNLTSPIAAGSSLRARLDSTDSTSHNHPTEYHFNHVLPDITSQDKIYYTLGLPIVTATMASLKAAESGGRANSATKPKSHLLICMGVANSGKTYTCLGGSTIPKRRASQDGLIPRLLDSLFSQSKHHANGSSKVFSVQISMVQVTQPKGGSDTNACQIHDLLAPQSAASSSKNKLFGSSPKRVSNLTVRNMAARFDKAVQSPVAHPDSRAAPSSEDGIAELDAENIQATVHNCKDVTQAREILQVGLNVSQKLTKGNQNFHLYVTMQPVIDGVKLGDKISILDMAGLEKEKRGQNSRGKDSVASMNQAGSAAVLHCLRTMIHNVNIRSGKLNTLDFASADDEVSEISFLSQQKDPLKRQLKSVPFRQHKVTMLLNPLFTKSASVKVTLILAAYPGHVDLPQKRMLLQDIELLHGSFLALACNNASAETGLTRLDSLSASSSSSNDQEEVAGPCMKVKMASELNRTNGFDSKVTPAHSSSHTESSTLSYQESDMTNHQRPHQEPQDAAGFPQKSFGVPNSNKIQSNLAHRVEPVTRPATLAQRVQSVARPGIQNATILAPRAEPQIKRSCRGVETKMNFTSQESFQPNLQVRVAPTAPDLRDIVSSQETPPAQDIVSDFPGVNLPLPMKEAYRLTNRSRMSPIKPTLQMEDENEGGLYTKEASASKTKEDSFENRELLKSPLGRSFLENSGSPSLHQNALPSSNSRHNFKICKNGNLNSSPSLCKLESMKKTKESSHVTEDLPSCVPASRNLVELHLPNHQDVVQIQKLESKLKELLQEKKAMEQICSQLERENAELKKAAREAGRAGMQSKWTDQDEKEFQASRRLRLESQTLIKAPVRSHMESVNYIYEIKNQWCMTNKPHFSLHFPNKFQRATELDVRDKEKKELEKIKEEIPTSNQPELECDQAADGFITGKKLTYVDHRKSLTPPKMSAPPLEPRGMAALKKLAVPKKLK